MKSTDGKTIASFSVFASLLCAAIAVSEGGHSSYCQIRQADILRLEADVKVSRNYKGLWVSQKCEIQPGPRFQVRRYHIFRNGHFHLVRYYYLDPWCTKPDYSISAVGYFVPPPEKATSSADSWVVPGGMELDYILRKVIVVPFTVQAADRLSRKVNSSCPGAVLSSWKPYKKYKVLAYEERTIRKKKKYHLDLGFSEDMDCMDSLNLNFNELQLMRLEYRPPLPFDVGPSQEYLQKFHSQLLLGAEGPQAGNRPTYYQVPLLASQTDSCSFCRVLSKSSAMSPPQLPTSQRLYLTHADLNGHWMSLRCEVHPYGLFLIRIFIFNSKDSSWQFRHLYYRDAKCLNPMFILSAKGSYKVGKPSDTIPDAVEYEFHVSESFLTPEDKQFVNNLIGLRSCGSSSNWKINQMVNITAFGGCKELGITVPSTEKDLVRFEGREPDLTFLYLGEASEDHQRPTSFQPALMRCTSLNVAYDDDFLLNYNHLRPLPLVSGSSDLQGIFYHIIGLIISYDLLLRFRDSFVF